MAAFKYRMGAGFAGDVNRTHPATIEPTLVNSTAVTAPTAFGQAVILDTTSQAIRPFASGDASDSVQKTAYGMTVRPYPYSPSTATNYGAADFGTGAPPSKGITDVLRAGYILAKVNGTTTKGGVVYVWCAATSGTHVLGQLEAGFSSTNTAVLAGATFNGVPDANGIVEIAFNI